MQGNHVYLKTISLVLWYFGCPKKIFIFSLDSDKERNSAEILVLCTRISVRAMIQLLKKLLSICQSR